MTSSSSVQTPAPAARAATHKSRLNYLCEKVTSLLSERPRGKLLDLGCGDGSHSKRLADLGFQVTACDMDRKNFRYSDSIDFRECSLGEPLPFERGAFDHVIFLEVIEHLYNPGFVVAEISRVLKPSGRLTISTPNILNIGSRLRFLFEGAFDFFREPPLEYSKAIPSPPQFMHVIPWRYQDLEYLLEQNGLHVEGVHTDLKKESLKIPALLLRPILALQCRLKERRTRKKGGLDYGRMNRIILSDDVLRGRHLILEALKLA